MSSKFFFISETIAMRSLQTKILLAYRAAWKTNDLIPFHYISTAVCRNIKFYTHSTRTSMGANPSSLTSLPLRDAVGQSSIAIDDLKSQTVTKIFFKCVLVGFQFFLSTVFLVSISSHLTSSFRTIMASYHRLIPSHTVTI